MFEALKIILKNTKSLDNEEIPLQLSYNRVLAQDVQSDIDIPPFNKSAMDGYAVKSSDLVKIPAHLTITESIPAGSIGSSQVFSGTCVKIMTGAPVPEGADSVIMIEDTETLSQGRIRIHKKCSHGQNICAKGEDIKKGMQVLGRGAIIHGPEIATLASVGKQRVCVRCVPSVGIVSTGNEIIEPAEELRFGKIRNSNGPMLTALVQAIGCNAHYLGIAGDEEVVLRDVIHKGLAHDLLLLSGGVSMGDYDLIPSLLDKEGAEILFHKVWVKPGKPLLFAKKGKCLIFGIPGNPVSNFTTFQVFIKPALYKMMGRGDYNLRFENALLSREFQSRSNRVHIVPGRYTIEEGYVYISPISLNGSADIIGCTGTNCLAVIEEGTRTLKKGARVNALLIDVDG